MTRSGSRIALALAASTGMLWMGFGCSGSKKREVTSVQVQPREVPEPLRGTVGSLAQSNAGEPILISGFGIVVGLNGTGGGLLDERIASTMEREMSLRGVGRGASELEGTSLENPLTRQPKSPNEILRDPNVAVVLVQAVIPRGAPRGFDFDVYLQAMNATSLEGGKLWTTDLRLGPPGVFGGVQTRKIGEARGDVFINPFEDPAESSGVESRTIGRVLAGGLVAEPFNIRLTLDVPSHQRARTIVHAINSRFPQGPNDPEPTARGRDDAIIELAVPWEYQERPNEFLRIVEHLPVDQTYAQVRARQFVTELAETPPLREDMMWCLVAIGDRAIPFLRELYEQQNAEVRLYALRAGAILGDARAAPSLVDVAQTGSAAARSEAISLLGELDGGPSVDIALRELLLSGTLSTRVAAYEALATRAERSEYARLLAIESRRPAQSGMARTPAELAMISRLVIPARSMQGIQRVTVPGKFVLDVVPYGEPLVYVTQQGTPRIVLFGQDLTLDRPMLADAWDDRLLLVADSSTEMPRLRYADYRTGEIRIEEVSERLPDLVLFMARDPRPEDRKPGLGFSYSEVVGALYALYDDGATRAAFATETDKLMAELVEAARGGKVLQRPETIDEKSRPDKPDDGLVVDPSYLKAERARRPQVVPLAPREPKKK